MFNHWSLRQLHNEVYVRETFGIQLVLSCNILQQELTNHGSL